jgi:hypothetical protein
MDEKEDGELSGAESVEMRIVVEAVAGSLRGLHRALVKVARQEYEAVHGEVQTSGKLLQLLAHDPEFWWLRRLSGLMVDIDEMLDREVLSPADAATVRYEVERLITSSLADDSEFSRKYLEALQSDPEVVMEHAGTRKALAALPKGGE